MPKPIKSPVRLVEELGKLEQPMFDHGRLRVMIKGVMYAVSHINVFGDRVCIMADTSDYQMPQQEYGTVGFAQCNPQLMRELNSKEPAT